MTADPVFSLAHRNGRIVHIERDYATTWCGIVPRLRTEAPTLIANLCPKCKSAHAAAFGLPSLSRRAKR